MQKLIYKTTRNKTVVCILYMYLFVYKKYSQNMKYNVKRTIIFHLILVGIPSRLILSNRLLCYLQSEKISVIVLQT